ncbi:MAG TPA: mechanosensitive ion channel family protein [Bacteroidales bacterium]|jgi:MscS family membrane protein|nr:mechanosensitive ion channel family protein [Bacteroidales bacterium]
MLVTSEAFPFNMELNQWLVFAFLFASILLLGQILKLVFKRVSKRSMKANIPVTASFFEAFYKSLSFISISIALWIGFKIVEIPENYSALTNTVSEILIVLSFGILIYYLVEIPAVWFEILLDRSNRSLNKMFIPVFRKTLRVFVVILIIIQVIQILSDKPITSIIAGLGIGGIAIAFAAQDTLRHFIGSFVIAGDRPFEIGERILIDGHDGPVESIGLRTTRIRTLDGHLVSIPNGELANKTIMNIAQRPNIKRTINIGVTYDTKPEKIQEGLDILKSILENHEGMDEEIPPRVFFSDLNADSLNLRVIYWYHPPSYWDFVAFSEKVNLEIIKRFNEAGIEFAFPTQTIHLAKEKNDVLTEEKP